MALSAASLSAQGARFVTSGIGCPTPTPPTLSLTAAPLLGTTTTLKVSTLPLDAPLPFALLAGTQTNVPLDFLGATGCTLFVDNVIVSLPMSLTVPTATLPLALPANPAFAGVVLELQAGALSPSSNPFGLATSDRGTMTLGNSLTVLRLATCPANYASCLASSTQPAPEWMLANYASPSNYTLSALPVTTTSSHVIAEIEGLGGSGLTTPTWAGYAAYLNLFSGMAAFAASPTAGDLIANAPLVFAPPASSIPGLPTVFLMRLTPAARLVLPGGTFLMSVQLNSFGGAASWGWAHSTFPLGSDDFAVSGVPGTFDYFATLGYSPGSQAITIKGY